MNAPLDFPMIAEAEAAKPVSLETAALAPFLAIESQMLALAEKYRECAYDCTTTKGMDAAKAARLELREKGRYAVQRAADKFKKDANAAKKSVDAKAEALIEIIKPAEDAIDAQIKAEEDRKAAEKAERERLEAIRIGAHQDKIVAIGAYVTQARERNLTSEQIGKGIDKLQGMTFGAEWEEFASKAAEMRDATVEALGRMQADAKAREEAEALRIENERVAAELAAQRAELERQAAELLRKMQEASAPVIEQAMTDALIRGEGGFSVKSDGEVTLIGEMRDAAPAMEAVESQPWAMPTLFHGGVVEAVQQQAERTDEPATLKLGVICERLGFTVTAAFLAETLHVHHSATDKAAKLYRESDWPVICRQLIAHIGAASDIHSA